MSVKLKQLGPNQTSVEIGDVTLYFSYETCVAFRAPGYGLVCSENVWGVATGKHLNAIQPDKKRRTERGEFEDQLSEVLPPLKLR